MENRTKPDWIKVKALSETAYSTITSISHKYSLHTVCQEALCPNINECWSLRTATFLLLGDICTRNCRFCSVKTGNPDSYSDKEEPFNVAKAVKELDLKHIVLTSVDRDDLDDGGAEHFAKTIREINKINDNIAVEILIPDFNNKINSLEKVISAKPFIIGHNIETVERLSPLLRDKRAGYKKSLDILRNIKVLNSKINTKSAIQLGFGETEREIKQTLNDLKENYVDIIVMGQYLRPTDKQIQVTEYIHPDKFIEYKQYAENLGFLKVISSPLARSSYKEAGKNSQAFI
ncbi:MAG: lipoyl synthase [Candidatus Gastranaerophilales bacterium]|nr:lipoyl synthase [Candidatus Gastranaerophilales bacterium]